MNAIDNPDRLHALKRFDSFTNTADAALDRFTSLAVQIMHTPISFISLVHQDQQAVKSQQGLREPFATSGKLPRTHSLCSEVVASDGRIIVENVSITPGLPENIKLDALNIGAYVGLPLRTVEGYIFGVFCVIDIHSHQWTPDDLNALVMLAAAAEHEMNTRVELNAKDETLALGLKRWEQYRQLIDNSTDAMLLTELNGGIIAANPAATQILGHSEQELQRMGRTGIVDTTDPRLPVALAERRERGSFRGELRMLRADGTSFEADIASHVYTTSNGSQQTSMIIRDITDKKRMEQQLYESQQQFYKIFVNNPVAIAVSRLSDGRIIDSNDSFLDFTGYTHAELVENSIGGLWSQLAPAAWFQLQADLQTHGFLRDRELQLSLKEGVTRYALASFAAIEIAGTLCFLSTIIDITIRKEAETRLHESEERFRQLAENTRHAFWLLTPDDGNIIYVSPAYQDIWGRTPESLIKKPLSFADAIHPDDRQKILAKRQATLLTGDYNVEYRVIRPDGAIRWVWTRAFPVRNDNGQVHRVVCISEDITDRKQAEESLARERNLLKTLVDNIPDFIYIKDTESRFVLNNIAHARSILDTDKTEVLIGLNDFDVFPKEMAKKFSEDDQLVIQNGTAVINREEESIGPNKRRIWVITTKVPLRDANGKIIGLVGITRDISQMKRNAELLKNFALELERSNRELQDFASVASHDLQEPLRKIRAFGNRLSSAYSKILDEKGQDYLNRMMNAAERMQTLINDLLTFARVASKAQPFVSTNLNKTTQEVLADLEIRIEQLNGQVEVATLPTIQADPLQMRQLLQNLIGNALKFHKMDHPPIVKVYAIDLPTESAMCELVIQDNGIGFDEKYVDRIFGIFQRLHGREAYEGTGVGLAICRKIVERHGGMITAHSVEGHGTSFIIQLPFQQPEQDLFND